MTTAIFVENLCKTFSVRKSLPGLSGTLRSLIRPQFAEFQAANALTFCVQRGEKIAFIGPNGAGKSTTIKMLTGILYPTSGRAEVLGLVPWKQRKKLAYLIGTVFGQRSQLWFQLPALDTFKLLAKIYELPRPLFKERLDSLVAMFEIEALLDRPVRQLSLGERMRCELVASLIHNPQILFLDEPTIGLDINAKLQIRTYLNRLAKEHATTLFLTSHDTADIEQVASRMLVLDKGSLLLDCSIANLKEMNKNASMEELIRDIYESAREV